jgi:hypothetical protein
MNENKTEDLEKEGTSGGTTTGILPLITPAKKTGCTLHRDQGQGHKAHHLPDTLPTGSYNLHTILRKPGSHNKMRRVMPGRRNQTTTLRNGNRSLSHGHSRSRNLRLSQTCIHHLITMTLRSLSFSREGQQTVGINPALALSVGRPQSRLQIQTTLS